MEAEQMTLEQCKKLKEWGLPQFKQAYFYVVYPVSGDATLYSSIAKNELAFDWETVSCPDLEQLLEFANGKISDVLMLSPSSHFLSLDCPTGDVNWEVRYTTATGICAGDPDPKVAVYKLLEKILEAKA